MKEQLNCNNCGTPINGAVKSQGKVFCTYTCKKDYFEELDELELVSTSSPLIKLFDCED